MSNHMYLIAVLLTTYFTLIAAQCTYYTTCQYNPGGSCGSTEFAYVMCSYNMSCLGSQCTTGYASGATCSMSQDCQAGLQCMGNVAGNKVCSPQYILPGQACTNSANCIYDASPTASSSSVCTLGKCLGLGVGSTCTYGGTQCNDPLFCQYSTSKCQNPIAKGQSCQEYYDTCAGVLGACYATDSSRQTAICGESLTKPAGAYCYRTVECGDGLYCDSTTSVCTAAGPSSYKVCTSNSDCLSTEQCQCDPSGAETTMVCMSSANPIGYHDAVYDLTACQQANPACNFQECDACLSQHCEVIRARKGIILNGELCELTAYQRAYLLNCSHDAKYHNWPADPVEPSYTASPNAGPASPAQPSYQSYPASPASNYSQGYNYSGSTDFDNCTSMSNSSMSNSSNTNGSMESGSMESGSMSSNSTTYICMNSTGTYNCTSYMNNAQPNCTNITQPSPSPSPTPMPSS